MTVFVINTKLWFGQNIIHLNEDKTQYILLGDAVLSEVGPLLSKLKSTVKSLGVVFKFDTN